MHSTRIIGINIITIISILFAHGGDHARGGHKHEGCTIYGTVIDSITNKAIEYTSISVIDLDGVVFAAIQGLYLEVQEAKTQPVLKTRYHETWQIQDQILKVQRINQDKLDHLKRRSINGVAPIATQGGQRCDGC